MADTFLIEAIVVRLPLVNGMSFFQVIQNRELSSMKKFVTLCVMGLMVSACQFSTAADLKSGLQIDDSPPPFNVTDVTGPVAGTKLCYRCQYGSRPVVSIFVRKMDENTAKLVKQVDDVVGKQEGKKMAAFKMSFHRENITSRLNHFLGIKDKAFFEELIEIKPENGTLKPLLIINPRDRLMRQTD